MNAVTWIAFIVCETVIVCAFIIPVAILIDTIRRG